MIISQVSYRTNGPLVSIKIRVAYTYVLQGLKIHFCLRPCLMTGLGEILEA